MKQDNGGQAFPLDGEDGTFSRGMTLRDYFAAAALPALEVGARDNMDMDWWYPADKLARRAYAIADAMLRARKA
jgi:hypothetical protein